MQNIEDTLTVYNKVNTLKDESRVRRGWVVRNIPERVESVAEHCFAMSNLAILLNLQYQLNLDMSKVLTMINIHEYGEVEIGDVIPSDNVSREKKHELELNGIKKILKNHPGQNTIVELWKEFEEAETDEAIFVCILDKFQSVLQAKEYSEKYQRKEIFDEFRDWYLKILEEKHYETTSLAIKILHL